MGNLLLNIRYLLAPVLIIVAGTGVLIGGIMAWLGVVLLFVGLLVDIATKFETTGVGYNNDTRWDGRRGNHDNHTWLVGHVRRHNRS